MSGAVAASCRRSRQRQSLSRVVPTVTAAAFLFVLLLQASSALAILLDPIKPASKLGSTEEWLASIQAIKALGNAIEDEKLQQQVRTALESPTTGFRPCTVSIYRCNAEDKILEVVIDELVNGRVNWMQLPPTVKRIFVRNSTLNQPLIMSELPAQLEEFSVTNTRWSPATVAAYPAGAMTHDGALVTPCVESDAHKCTFSLQTLQCENCELTAADFRAPSTAFPSLTAINLNGNSRLTIDVKAIPKTVESLQVANTKFLQTTVAEVLEGVPASVEQLNISFGEVAFQLSMLAKGQKALAVLDASSVRITPESSSEPFCVSGGFALSELYLSNCSLGGSFPELSKCTALTVLDLSQNSLEKIDFERLPRRIEVLHLNDNELKGELGVKDIPRGLRSLDVSSNHLYGSIDIADLPQNIQYFDVSNNAFSGNVNLTLLPESARFVYLQNNRFTGEANLVDIPLGIRFIMIYHNDWDYRLPAP